MEIYIGGIADSQPSKKGQVQNGTAQKSKRERRRKTRDRRQSVREGIVVTLSIKSDRRSRRDRRRG
jgi:hypothetical protein